MRSRLRTSDHTCETRRRGVRLSAKRRGSGSGGPRTAWHAMGSLFESFNSRLRIIENYDFLYIPRYTHPYIVLHVVFLLYSSTRGVEGRDRLVQRL